MTNSMVASHAAGKVLGDAIFGASAAAQAAAAKYGADKVTNATIGAIMGDDEKLACIPTMEKVFRSLPMSDIIAYAPIVGLPGYLDTVVKLTFADQQPDGYTAAGATAGGTGAVHNAIANYSEIGDKVLTSDWFWGPYTALCHEQGRELTTYQLFDEEQNFNIKDFTAKVTELLKKQSSLLIIINTPAHNPTGYSLSEDDWKAVIDVCKTAVKSGDKKVSILVDIAYIDYAGEKNETRKFMKLFGGLPNNIFVMFAFSMSKGYTMYGQRTGAIIGLSQSKEIVDEFANANKYTSRATWSNINRGAMTVLTKIQQDATLLAQFEKERAALYETIKERGAIFMNEAKECGLNALPYKAGFFLSIPAKDPGAVCDKLHDDLIFPVPLKKGVRVAVCAVPAAKMRGMAAKIKKAWDAVEK
ncbi:MAG: pyridoxal phosphate-dependent aminotransferase [Selenomonadaceae bacterium]